MATAGPLILTTAPREWVEVRRRGRFTVPRAVALDPGRMLAATQEAQEEFIRGMALKGYIYVDKGFEVRGPLAAMEFSDDTTADAGPHAMPDPRDETAMAAWGASETAKTAKRFAYQAEYCDFQLIGHFRVRNPMYKTVIGGTEIWTA